MMTKKAVLLVCITLSLILGFLIYKNNKDAASPLVILTEKRGNIQEEHYKSKNSENIIYYNEIKIGNQVWMSENLNVSTFNNGDIIPYIEDDNEWKAAIRNEKPAWSYYLNSLEYGRKYGKLYNWFALNDSRGIAPKGWHIPTNYEWDILKEYLGGSKIAGMKIKSKEGWYIDNPKNESGFNALESGIRNFHGGFDDNCAAYWTAPIDNNGDKVFDFHSLMLQEDKFFHNSGHGSAGISIRCIKNNPN
jgi:uncharacterized protein (TIGR02145 family)